MSDFLSHEEDTKDLQGRFKVVYFMLALVSVTIVTRLWILQVMEGSELRLFSEKNRIKETKIAAPRGLILDRDKRTLVDNITGFDATITPQYTADLEETAKIVGPIIGKDPDAIVTLVKKSRRQSGPFLAATVKENLTLDEVYWLERARFDNPGIKVVKRILRHYPLDDNGAQLFGYVSEVSKKQLEVTNKKYAGDAVLDQGDLIGQSGLEEIWDLNLRGKDGLSFIEVDAHGREARSQASTVFELQPRKEIPGNNLVLTIDEDLQKAAFKAMTEQKDHIGPRIGSLVAMKSNGEILAWISLPSFNPNKFARGITPDLWKELVNHPFKPLRNKVIQDHYPPGSSIKPLVALAALQENVVGANTIVSAPGSMRFGNRVYHDSLKQGHGNINIRQAIESSSNIFFYKMGIQLGIDNIAKYVFRLGLGQRTSVGLNNEVPGVFPTKDWKLKATGEPWQPGENLSNAIGQGFVLTTLLQMAVAYNAIGMNGKVYKPFLVKQVLNQEGQVVKEFEPAVLQDVTTPDENGVVLDPKNLASVRDGMWRVANGEKGTARWWKIPGVEFAGKTGTSQVMSFSADEIYDRCENRPLRQRHHGLFIAYAPADNPVVTIAALTEHSCHGNTGSAPIVRDVFRAYFEKYDPERLKVTGKGGPKKAELPVVPPSSATEGGD
jgi:penicillin-binding protein 2